MKSFARIITLKYFKIFSDSSLQAEEGSTRRGSSISYYSPYVSSRRQTFHAQGPLLPKSYVVPGFTGIYTTDQEKLLNKNAKDHGKLENVIDNQKLLRRMSSVDYKRRSSLSVGNSRRGSLFKPRAELQALIGLSKSAGLMSCPTPKQLLSLTELVIDEKEREKRILRKALSMENRTASEEISSDCAAPGVLMIPTPYSSDKIHLRPPEDDKFKKAERRPLFRQQKSTETMEKIEEGFAEQNVAPTKSLLEKRKSNFKQMSLDSKSFVFDKAKEIHPEEIAMVVQERRTPYLRELRSQTHDFSLDETPFATSRNENETRPTIRRQLTTPCAEESPIRRRKPNLVRQDRQEIASSESLTKTAAKDNLPLSVLEMRDSLIAKVEQSSGDDIETAETSLTGSETTTLVVEKASDDKGWKTKPPNAHKGKLLEALLETSTSSNSTTATNMRSDSIISEDAEKDSKSEIRSEDSKTEFETEGKDKGMEKKTISASKERLIGTSSEDCYDTSEEDVCQKPDGKY